MGINVNGLRFLLYAKSTGVDFSRTAMIGRQGLHLAFNQLSHIFKKEFSYDVDNKTLKAIYDKKYCDDLLRYLGANIVHSFDYSDFEGSTHVHDFNLPIPEQHMAQYSAIIEGGTLEHVFNFPIAIKNCMQMIEVGGHYLGISPTNNYMGHGFYQFSPELYFRVFSPDNGFLAKHIIFHEGRETKKWFNVPDPKIVQRSVGLTNTTSTLLLILATRTADCPIFSTPPLQSLYISAWNKVELETNSNDTKNSLSGLKHWIPQPIKNFLRRRHGNTGPLFTPFNPFEVKATPKLDFVHFKEKDIAGR